MFEIIRFVQPQLVLKKVHENTHNCGGPVEKKFLNIYKRTEITGQIFPGATNRMT